MKYHERYYDVTHTLHNGMVVWPGDRPVEISTQDAGDYRITGLSLSAHTGTHVDAPSHFIHGGAGADGLELHTMLGKARLVRVTGIKQIGFKEIAGLPLEGITRLLLATDSGPITARGEFDTTYTSLTEAGASSLIERGIGLVGIDSPSVDPFNAPGHPAHHALMEAGVIIIEGLDLTGVPEGDYELICLPLKIERSDGAPARVVLREL